MSLNPGVIHEIATELGVNPSFIEKDWYAIKVVAAIASISNDSIVPVFCGGTSLSKAFGLLQRFSEDLDFRGQSISGGISSRPVRRAFRNDVLAAVATVDGIDFDQDKMDAGSNYFKVALQYPCRFDVSSALRSELQLEFSFTQPQCEAESRLVSSFVAEYSDVGPETRVLCLSPIETAADKMSALVWRVIKRDRSDENDDPTMIRHLHDLSLLMSIVQDGKSVFIETATSSFQTDMQSDTRTIEGNLPEAATRAVSVMRSDRQYAGEYEQFVAGMSYADEGAVIPYEKALEQMERLIDMF